MQKLLLISILAMSLSSSAQDVLPVHTLKEFDLVGDVKSATNSSYDYFNGEYEFYSRTNAHFTDFGKLYYFKDAYMPSSGIDNVEYYMKYDSAHNPSRMASIVDPYHQILELYNVDEKGNVVGIDEKYIHSKEGYHFNYKIIYDAYGKPKVREQYKNQTLSEITYYIYDGDKLISQTRKNSRGLLIEKFEYTYKKGARIKEVYTNDSSEIVTDFTYYPDGKLKKFVGSDGFVMEYEYLETDKKGNWNMQKTVSYFAANPDQKLTTINYRKLYYYDGYMSGRVHTEPMDGLYNFSEIDLSIAEVTKKEDNYEIQIKNYLGTYNLKSFYLGGGKDLVIYERNSGASYLVKNFKSAANDTKYKPEYLGRNITTWVKGDDGGYWLHYKGDLLTENTSAWMGDTLVVYNKKNEKTFLLAGYKGAATGKLNTAIDYTNYHNSFYVKDGEGYRLYSNGKRVFKDLKSFYIGSSLIVYEPETHNYYVLKNYNDVKLHIMLPVTIGASSLNPVCIKTNYKDNIQVADEGELIKFDDPTYRYDALIFKIKGKEFRVSNYRYMQPLEIKKADF